MAITSIWGELNVAVQDAPNDPNNDLQNGYQSSCGGAANPEPLDFYLWEVGTCIRQLEADVVALAGGGTISGATNLGAQDLFVGVNGSNLEFRGLTNTDGLIDVSTSGNNISIDLDEAALTSNPTFQAGVDARIPVTSIGASDGFIDVTQAGTAFGIGLDEATLFASTGFQSAVDSAVASAFSNTATVGGVYTHWSTAGINDTAVVQIPAGGTWRAIVTFYAAGPAGVEFLIPNGTLFSSEHGGQAGAVRAGSFAGGTSFSVRNFSISIQLGIFAIRIA